MSKQTKEKKYTLKPAKVGQAVIDTYQKIEDTVVGSYKKIETAFVDRFLEEVDTDAGEVKKG
jgi:hypothetical protein